ncbi:11504_t:CDS:2, partial [Cetraspora pellucida]
FNNELYLRHQIFPHLDPNMLRDLQHELHHINPFVHSFHAAGEAALNNSNAILDIESHLFQNGKSILDFPDLPIANNALIQSIRLCTTNLLIAEETNYNQ